jgi:hypothetical protein
VPDPRTASESIVTAPPVPVAIASCSTGTPAAPGTSRVAQGFAGPPNSPIAGLTTATMHPFPPRTHPLCPIGFTERMR